MDAETRAIYEARASEWAAKRRVAHLDAVHALAQRSSGPSIDLGCGPGWHTSALPGPAVALDVTGDMQVSAAYKIRGNPMLQYDANGNIGVGPNVLPTSTGYSNVQILAGGALTTGYGNVLIGESTGGALTTGSSNVLVGFRSGTSLVGFGSATDSG